MTYEHLCRLRSLWSSRKRSHRQVLMRKLPHAMNHWQELDQRLSLILRLFQSVNPVFPSAVLHTKLQVCAGAEFRAKYYVGP